MKENFSDPPLLARIGGDDAAVIPAGFVYDRQVRSSRHWRSSRRLRAQRRETLLRRQGRQRPTGKALNVATDDMRGTGANGACKLNRVFEINDRALERIVKNRSIHWRHREHL